LTYAADAAAARSASVISIPRYGSDDDVAAVGLVPSADAVNGDTANTAINDIPNILFIPFPFVFIAIKTAL
jgi:hypothetical protein